MSAWDVLYWYRMTVHKVYDADSITKATLDQGFKRYEEDCNVRLDQIDAPEMRGKEVTALEKAMARAATRYLQEQAPVGSKILVHSQKIMQTKEDKESRDDRGRILAWVYTNRDGLLDNWDPAKYGMPQRAFSLNSLLLKNKIACPYDGKGSRPAKGDPEWWPRWYRKYEKDWYPLMEKYA